MCNGCWHGVGTNRWILVFVICLSYLFVIVECRAAKNNEVALPRQTVTLSPFLTTLSLRIAFVALLALVGLTGALLSTAAGILSGVGFVTLVSMKTLAIVSLIAGIVIFQKLSSKFSGLSGSSKPADSAQVWPAPSQSFQAPLQQPSYQPQQKYDYWRNERSDPYYDNNYNSVMTY